MLFALELEWEAIFSAKCYGFRPGRGVPDAHRHIKQCLILGRKWINDADIEKCFDKIEHEPLLNKLTQKRETKIPKQIKAWLSAGILDEKITSTNEKDTPQGGIISPLLANIALHGLEEAAKTSIKISNIPNKATEANRCQVITYADDLIIMAKSYIALEKAIETVKMKLEQIGLNFSIFKSRVTTSSEGFEYLGCRIFQRDVGKYRQPKEHRAKITWRVVILPTKKNIDRHFGKIRKLAKKSANLKTLIPKLNTVIVGYKQFVRYTDAGTWGLASRWTRQLYMIVHNWLRRQYRTSGKNPKYYKKIRNRDWVPYVKTKTSESYLDTYYREGDTYGINQHIKVKGNKSPYNGDWAYWGTRSVSNNYISDQKLRLLRKQIGRCIACKGIFTPTDILQVDHIIPRSKGGGSNLLNLQLLHQECHEKKTAKKRTEEIDSQAELAEQLCKGKPLRTVLEEKPRG